VVRCDDTECALLFVGRNDFVTSEVLYADGGSAGVRLERGDRHPSLAGVSGANTLDSEIQNKNRTDPPFCVTIVCL
jgi:hypothetical protein